MMTLAHVRIVLVEPAGPLNVGAIARVMKNMGLHHLVLVNPQCDCLSAEAQRMAVHATDVLTDARRVATLPEALRGCDRAIATTARSRSLPTLLESPRIALPWLLQTQEQQNEIPAAALIFGPEDRGLSNVELNYAQRFISIPTSPIYPSLNLAQAVAICCYELHLLYASRTNQNGDPVSTPDPDTPTFCPEIEDVDFPVLSDAAATSDVLEGYYQQLETLLLKIGYLYPHTVASRMGKFRRMFNRARLSPAEVSMLRGILRQMEWALHSN